jgi:hypothetical protein
MEEIFRKGKEKKDGAVMGLLSVQSVEEEKENERNGVFFVVMLGDEGKEEWKRNKKGKKRKRERKKKGREGRGEGKKGKERGVERKEKGKRKKR